MREYRWLLLDADNTLFDFDCAEQTALIRLLTHYGLPPTAELQDCYRSINSALWSAFDRGEITQEKLGLERFYRFFALLGITGDAQEWNQFYLNSLSDCPVLLPGAEELCRSLSGKYVLALATNGVPFVQRRRLENSPLVPFFGDRVFISGEMGCRKPEKIFYEKALSRLGASCQRDKVLAIGDSLSSDIQGAFNACLDSVWIRWSHSGSGPAAPTYEVENLTQLAKLLGADCSPFSDRS